MSKICPVCRTPNEEEYNFCKNCGSLLNPDSKYAPPEDPVQNKVIYSTEAVPDMVIDGVPLEDISDFIGSRSQVYVNKFIKSETKKSKIGWNWTVAVLSFLFGPLGAAISFFYRKMNKFGTILLCIAAAFNILFVYGSIANNAVFAGISLVLNIITAIFFGMLYDGIYKSFAVKKIKVYHSEADPRYYKYGLTFLGGTAIGTVMVVILGMIIFNFLVIYLFPFFYNIRR